MYEKEIKILILSGDFRFRFSAENECLFSFSAVNGISFSSAFSFTAENEKKMLFGRHLLVYSTKKVLVLVLRCIVLVLVLNSRLGLERILKSWSWS